MSAGPASLAGVHGVCAGQAGVPGARTGSAAVSEASRVTVNQLVPRSTMNHLVPCLLGGGPRQCPSSVPVSRAHALFPGTGDGHRRFRAPRIVVGRASSFPGGAPSLRAGRRRPERTSPSPPGKSSCRRSARRSSRSRSGERRHTGATTTSLVCRHEGAQRRRSRSDGMRGRTGMAARGAALSLSAGCAGARHTCARARAALQR